MADNHSQPPTYQHALQQVPDRANLMAMSPSQLAHQLAIEELEHKRKVWELDKRRRELELQETESRLASRAARRRSSMTCHGMDIDEATTKLNRYLDIILRSHDLRNFAFDDRVCYSISDSFESSFSEPPGMSGNARQLRMLLRHILLVDYGIADPKANDADLHAALSEMAEALKHYQPGQILDDAYETDQYLDQYIRQPAQELKLPLGLVETWLLLHIRHSVYSSREHASSIDTFWACKGREALAFKLCCDAYIARRLFARSSVEHCYDVMGSVMSLSYRCFNQAHYWITFVEQCEADNPEIRTRREQIVARKRKEAAQPTQESKRGVGCSCM